MQFKLLQKVQLSQMKRNMKKETISQYQPDFEVNFYKLLEVDKNANAQKIKRNYRSKMRQWHPSKETYEMRIKRERQSYIQQAYEVLSNPILCLIYNRYNCNYKAYKLATRYLKQQSFDFFSFFGQYNPISYGSTTRNYRDIFSPSLNSNCTKYSKQNQEQENELEENQKIVYDPKCQAQ